MNTPSIDQQRWRATRVTPAPCFEWLTFATAGLPGELVACSPGAVVAFAREGGLALHPAPKRWVIAAPPAPLLQALQGVAAAGGGVLTEVTGKWRRVALQPPANAASHVHPLAAGVALGTVLAGRDCAALWLFDVPAILVRRMPAHEVWIEASYEASFVAMLATLDVSWSA